MTMRVFALQDNYELQSVEINTIAEIEKRLIHLKPKARTTSLDFTVTIIKDSKISKEVTEAAIKDLELEKAFLPSTPAYNAIKKKIDEYLEEHDKIFAVQKLYSQINLKSL